MKTETKITTYSSGKTKLQAQYRNDKEHGQWTLFYENGLVELIGSYTEGKEVGSWMEWYESGVKKEEATFDNGTKFLMNFWNENGDLTLKDGTGYTITKFGNSEGDIYRQFYDKGVFVNEIKIAGVSYGEFKESS